MSIGRKVPGGDLKLQSLGSGRFSITGAMTFATVTAILEASKEQFGDERVIKLDLSGVTEGDSAGLALLLEWINWAKAYCREIRYFGIPAPILAIARISEVEELLKAGEHLARPAQGAPSEAPAAV